jgi:hypothetical protein
MKNSSGDKSFKKYFENGPMLEMTFYHENSLFQSIFKSFKYLQDEWTSG